MKKYLKAALVTVFLFSAATVLSYAQDAAPVAGTPTTQATAKEKKEQKHHKKAPKAPKTPKAHPKKKAPKKEDTEKK